MNRDVAVSVLKEILEKLPDLNTEAITLMKSKSKSHDYYHVHISTVHISGEERFCLQEICWKYHLVYRENDGRVLIYTSIL